MRMWAFGAVVCLVASCYQAPATNESCTITCMAAEDSCPGDLTCRGGFCVSRDQVCRPLFAQVAVGSGFACALDESGARWCWGVNDHHQISETDVLQIPYATRVDLTRRWQKLEAGGGHACGLSDGRLYCWGNNGRGQVSDSVAGDVATPLEITIPDGPSAWTQVSLGEQDSCAIGDGKLWCWGANENGMLGDGTVSDRGVPTRVAGDVDDWIAVSAGLRTTCGISGTRGLFCWGQSSYGTTGVTTNEPQLTPNQIVDSNNQPTLATTVAVSAHAACATTPDESVVCWGDNSYNELGEEQRASNGTAYPLHATSTTGWKSVDGTGLSFCGKRDDQIVCWGTTYSGGFANGIWTRAGAFDVASTPAGASQPSLGWDETGEVALACSVVGSDVQCWGDDRFGQLGIGAPTMELTPTPVDGSHLFSDLDVGVDHACGVEGGKLLCWGSTELGAATGLIAGTTAKPCDPSLDCDVDRPKELMFFSAPATDVALGAYHSCALHGTTITCWGDNGYGQLVGTTPAPPRQRDIIAPGGAMWSSLVETGRVGQCARYTVGTTTTTACWGNVLQQRTGVTMVSALDNAKALALGSTTSLGLFDCILDANNALQCQGDNSLGEYGDGTTNAVTTLAPVTPSRTYTALATNIYAATMCGIRPDLQVECWGANDRGQTSEIATTTTLSPVIVPGLSSCTAIVVGFQHACALCGGAIECWGDNAFGQLGSGTLDSSPVPLPRAAAMPDASDPWVQIVAGFRFTCARSEMGRVSCWGFSARAALGNRGRSTNLPVVVQATPAT